MSALNHENKNITLMTRASLTGAFDESCFEISRKQANAISGKQSVPLINVNDEHDALCDDE
jgi:hypothetical protein